MKRFCEICGGRDNKKIYEGSGCQLLKCKSCGFVYTKPFTKNLDKYYNSKEHTYAKLKEKQVTNRENFLRNIFQGFKKDFNFKKINYLDIGCGTGSMLKVAKEFGWNVFGCDICKSVVEYAKKQAKEDKIYVGDLINCKFQDSFFDFITMNHVIEHITNLNENIKEIKRILKPKGIIFIRCPNYKNILAVLGRKRIIMREHVNYFTNKDLIRLFKKYGFRVIKTPKTKNYRIDVYNCINHMLNYKLNLFEIFLTFKNSK